MPFLHPLIFWIGLGAVSIPIVIHLLNRRRFRLRDWAAMKFLLESMRKNRRRVRIEELVLLAIRCLVLLLLALAIAKFTGLAAFEGSLLGDRGAETAVFILDDSVSMGHRTDSSNLYDFAIAELGEQAKTLLPSARLAIVRTSNPAVGQGLAKLQELPDRESIAKSLRAQGLSDRRADMVGALQAAKTLLSGAGGVRRVYILSDFRKHDLAAGDQTAAMRKLVAELQQQGVQVVAADYGMDAKANLTVEEVRLDEAGDQNGGKILLNEPTRLTVRVRNNGLMPARQTIVELKSRGLDDKAADGQSRERAGSDGFLPAAPVQTIDAIAPGQTGECRFEAVFTRPGPLALRADVNGLDELPGDDAAYLAVEVRRWIRVLIVDDVKHVIGSPSSYVKAALDPRGDGSHGVSLKIVTSAEMGGEELDSFDAVMLLDVADMPAGRQGLPASAAGGLEAFVRAGGGLAIFTGDRMDSAFYNRVLYAGGKGLAPHAIGPRTGDPDRGLDAPTFAMKIADDPAARAARGELMRFANMGDVDIAGMLRFQAFTSVRSVGDAPASAPSEAADAPIVLARFTDDAHSPAIEIRNFGRGKVLACYTTANRRWGDWPVFEDGAFFVVAMNDMVRHLAGKSEPRNGMVGEAFEYVVPATMRESAASMTFMGSREPLQQWTPAGERIRCDGLDRAGAYALAILRGGKIQQSAVLARNIDTSEGRLAPAGQAGLASAIGQEHYYTQRHPMQAPQALLRPHREYWAYALGAMLALMGLETVLARLFGHYSRRRDQRTAA